MGDAGTMSVAASNNLTTTGVQAVTGAKTFSDQKLVLRNPADTFSTTVTNPVTTANITTELSRPFTHCIYKQGSTYKIMNGATGAVTSSSTLDTLVQTALDEQGLIMWIDNGAATTFQCSAGFTGWELSSFSSIRVSNNVRIQVPDTYTGYVFRGTDQHFGVGTGLNGLTKVDFQGGIILEGGSSPQTNANWDCFLLEASGIDSATGPGIERNKFRGIQAKYCNTMFHLKVSGAHGFINANEFQDCEAIFPRVGVNFDQSVAFVSGNGIHRNNFINDTMACNISNTPTMTFGYKDISGKANCFWNCKAWDTTSGNSDSNTTVNATDTIIIGGYFTKTPSTWWTTNNLGSGTRVIDEYNGTVFNTLMTENYQDVKIIAAPANASSGYIRKYPKATDANNDGLYAKTKLAGTVTEMRYWP